MICAGLGREADVGFGEKMVLAVDVLVDQHCAAVEVDRTVVRRCGGGSGTHGADGGGGVGPPAGSVGVCGCWTGGGACAVWHDGAVPEMPTLIDVEPPLPELTTPPKIVCPVDVLPFVAEYVTLPFAVASQKGAF